MRRRRRVVVVGLAALLLTTARGHAWLVRLQGSRAEVDTVARSIALAPDGTLLVGVTTAAVPGGCQTRVRKVTARRGRFVWERSFGWGPCDVAAPLSPSTLPLAMAIDAGGDVVLGLPGFVVVKLAGDSGRVRWRTVVNPHYPWASGSVAALAFDPVGDVVAAGTIDTTEDGDTYDGDFVVAKLAGTTGREVWHVQRNGQLPPCDPEDCDSDRRPDDTAVALSIDAAGTVYAAGSLQAPTGRTFLTLALDGQSGAERWRFEHQGEGRAVLAAGEVVYAAGTDGQSAVVVRLSAAAGVVGWEHVRPGYGYLADTAYRLAVTATGDVAVVIDTYPDPANPPDPPVLSDLVVLRLRAGDGSAVWERRLPAAAARALSFPGPLLAAPGGDLVVGSSTRVEQPPPGHLAAAIRRLDAENGADRWAVTVGGGNGDGVITAAALVGDALVLAGAAGEEPSQLVGVVRSLGAGDGRLAWQLELSGGFRGEDDAGSVAIDAQGDAVVVGSLQTASAASAAAQTDFAITKLAGRSGAELWRVELDGVERNFPGSAWDYGRDVALDAAGDVIAVGSLQNDAYDADAAVMKLDGATGTERWRQLLRGGDAWERDAAVGVVVDAAGDPTVLASLTLPGGNPSAWLVRLDGADGVERWRRPVTTSREAVAAFPAGDVVTGGSVYANTPATVDGAVVRLSGTTGVETWRSVLPGLIVNAVAVSGDTVAVAAGGVAGARATDGLAVALDAASGVERWRATLTTPAERPAYVARVTRAGSGAVLVSGDLTVDGLPASFVAALDGTSGAVRWRRVVRGTATVAPFLVPWYGGLVADAHGNVAAAIPLRNDAANYDFAVVGFDGDTGTERWRYVLDGTDTPRPDDDPLADLDRADALAASPLGDVVVVGPTRWVETGADLTVVSLRARSGALRLPDRARRCLRVLRRARAALASRAAHRAVRAWRGRLGRACAEADLLRAGACASRLDEVLFPLGVGGCLLEDAGRPGSGAAASLFGPTRIASPVRYERLVEQMRR